MERVALEPIHAFAHQLLHSSVVLETPNDANVVHPDRDCKAECVVSEIEVALPFPISSCSKYEDRPRVRWHKLGWNVE